MSPAVFLDSYRIQVFWLYVQYFCIAHTVGFEVLGLCNTGKGAGFAYAICLRVLSLLSLRLSLSSAYHTNSMSAVLPSVKPSIPQQTRTQYMHKEIPQGAGGRANRTKAARGCYVRRFVSNKEVQLIHSSSSSHELSESDPSDPAGSLSEAAKPSSSCFPF